LVSGLSTEAFFAALDRFFARRGISKHIYSDNGTNFVGASNEIKAVLEFLKSDKFKNKLAHTYNYDEIVWHFIPPRAPTFGGLWESTVKLVKYHMVRTVGGQLLTYEELNTVLYKIESILNSRPLTAESTDPNDFQVLTPGHFLIGRPLNSRPQSDVSDVPDNRLSRWHLIQKGFQNFWKRWSLEYLHLLQQRSKQFKSKVDVKPGALILVMEDNTPPLKWLTGRIIEVFPGKDGIVRVVSVKTPNGILKRPICKICPIPIEA
jgi:hypothetical protein